MISFLANPYRFLKFAKIAAPILGLIALFSIITGLWFGIWHSPQDYQQGHSVRILYIHVPAAWSAMMAYISMAGASLIAYIWRHPLADQLAKACALPGAVFTALTLITGAIWGKTSWGTYWQWDGRMTSVLVLLFLYIGYMNIWSAIDDKVRAAKIARIVAMVGTVNIPIIKFSVDWWNSLHQGSTFTGQDAPGLPSEMLLPLVLVAIGYSCFFGWMILNQVRTNIYKTQSLRAANKDQNNGPVSTIEINEL